MNDFIFRSIKEIIDHPTLSISIVVNLFIIESILSIDNAAMIASMIMQLKKEDRNKAIKYGIIGSYFFRGICLIFASFLIKIWWLKPIGGCYLIFIGLNHFFRQKGFQKIKKSKLKKENNFWRIIILIEMIDLAFSIDNIFASVALSENIIIIFFGVFIGILSIRLVSQFFIKLMEKFPKLETSSFYIIIILGIKLILSSFIKNDNFIVFYNFSLEEIFPLLTLFLFLSPVYLYWIKKLAKAR
ncbi:DUF475 domain-containing protein [Blattabacterium cuenoti]|uniref:DUF475 domain-containing protein n=1 Tax=Blattabacterium cuenoti TaxID=1653831 RepID=UPI00163C85D8|nr:DUF475 domain-containing protein [Blattabacterium cuenoti]